jgi:hypothetical protein
LFFMQRSGGSAAPRRLSGSASLGRSALRADCLAVLAT